MELQKYWDMVNSANTHQKIEEARISIMKDDELSWEDYDNLMMALSSLSRDLYRQERK